MLTFSLSSKGTGLDNLDNMMAFLQPVSASECSFFLAILQQSLQRLLNVNYFSQCYLSQKNEWLTYKKEKMISCNKLKVFLSKDRFTQTTVLT